MPRRPEIRLCYVFPGGPLPTLPDEFPLVGVQTSLLGTSLLEGTLVNNPSRREPSTTARLCLRDCCPKLTPSGACRLHRRFTSAGYGPEDHRCQTHLAVEL